jgi:hypothetical protein
MVVWHSSQLFFKVTDWGKLCKTFQGIQRHKTVAPVLGIILWSTIFSIIFFFFGVVFVLTGVWCDESALSTFRADACGKIRTGLTEQGEAVNLSSVQPAVIASFVNLFIEYSKNTTTSIEKKKQTHRKLNFLANTPYWKIWSWNKIENSEMKYNEIRAFVQRTDPPESAHWGIHPNV